MKTSSAPKNEDQARFLQEFYDGDSHRVLAERYGVNRGTISAWIKAAGEDPMLNVKKRREARREALEIQIREAAALQGRREQAKLELKQLADEFGVKPLTLAHWAEGTGHYTPGGKVNLKLGRPRRLPRRRSTQGVALARKVDAAAAPWTPRHVAGLLRRDFTPERQ